MHDSPFAVVAKAGDTIADLSTPRPIIDEDRLAANIARTQAYMDTHGINFRPHIKTHKIPALAAQQVAAGAKGINCQKITEAEVFAAAGFEDILITFNIIGLEKLAAPGGPQRPHLGLKVVADSSFTVDGLSAYFAARKPLAVLVECDTGGGRCGVQTPTEAAALASASTMPPGLTFAGLLNYPKPGAATEVQAFLTEHARAAEGRGHRLPDRQQWRLAEPVRGASGACGNGTSRRYLYL
jgi:D-serine deaminase-like pyridoxal phosphate-dependent protein